MTMAKKREKEQANSIRGKNRISNDLTGKAGGLPRGWPPRVGLGSGSSPSLLLQQEKTRKLSEIMVLRLHRTVEATWTWYIVYIQRCTEAHSPVVPFPGGICCTACGLRILSHVELLFLGRWHCESLAVSWDQHDRLETEYPKHSRFTS